MTQTLKIKLTPVEKRVDWQTIKQILSSGYSELEIVTMVNRYMDAQSHAVNYRVRAAEKNKAVRAKLAELGVDLSEL